MKRFSRLAAILTLAWLLATPAWAFPPFHHAAPAFNGAFFTRVHPALAGLPSESFSHHTQFTNNVSFAFTPGTRFPFAPAVQFGHHEQFANNTSFGLTPNSRFPFVPSESFSHHTQFTNNVSFAFTPGARFPFAPAERFTDNLTFNRTVTARVTPSAFNPAVPTVQFTGSARVVNNVSFNRLGPTIVPVTTGVLTTSPYAAFHTLPLYAALRTERLAENGFPYGLLRAERLALSGVPTVSLGFTPGYFNTPGLQIGNQIANVASTGYYTNLALQRASILTGYPYYGYGYGYPYSGYGYGYGYGYPSYGYGYGYPYSGYGYGYPYGGYPYGGYGYNPWLYGMMGGYGGGGGGGGGGPVVGGQGGIEAPMPPQKGDSPALEALGLPNAGGRLDWPLGFRLLPRNSEARVWQQQLDNLLPTAVAQAGEGQVNPQTVAEIKRSLDNLSDLLRSRAPDMPRDTAVQAERFLQQLNAAVKMLR
jgi:hypothetical protein